MRADFTLGNHDGSIAEARHHALDFLDRARAVHHLAVTPRARDLTQLVVSELVTNVRKYAPGPAHMELRISAGHVDVVVRDSSPMIPTAHAADPGRTGQHGLEIVEAVAEDLVFEHEPLGKRITARISLLDAARGAAVDPADPRGGIGGAGP
ncbi:ATP-binding protein [Streptomyces sp. NPDC057287]|uniref:ATP-binding protein n=1 Tax=Streptomyces sp. NPDC057287 TaxID=3346086 RepID=UPI00363D27A8